MADKLEIASSVSTYLTMKQLAHSGARTKGVPELLKGLLVFPFDTYADGDDQVLVYACERVRATAPATSTLLAAVTFAAGEQVFWDAGNSKLTNVSIASGIQHTPVGYVLEAKDLSGGVAAGDELLFELDPSTRIKVRSGEVTLDGANPTPITTGLTTIISASATLKSTSAPGDDPSWVSVDYSGGTLNIYAWKNTGGTDPTLVASTNNSAVFCWQAFGI